MHLHRPLCSRYDNSDLMLTCRARMYGGAMGLASRSHAGHINRPNNAQFEISGNRGEASLQARKRMATALAQIVMAPGVQVQGVMWLGVLKVRKVRPVCVRKGVAFRGVRPGGEKLGDGLWVGVTPRVRHRMPEIAR